MNISVLQGHLAFALSTVRSAVDARPQLPVLANVLIEVRGDVIQLSTTNLRQAVTVCIKGQVYGEGSVTLPFKTFYEYVGNLPNERVDLKLNENNDTVFVQTPKTKTNIKGISADDFPPMPHAESFDFELDARLFSLAVSRTQFAAAKDEARPILTGIYTEISDGRFTLASADGYRLSTDSFACDTSVSTTLVIPAKAMTEVAKIATTSGQETIGICLPKEQDVLSFHIGDIVISTQLLDGRYPDFCAIIPRSGTTSVVVKLKDLLRACRHTAVFARDNANSARIVVSGLDEPKRITLVGTSAERGDTETTINTSVEGEDVDISFNVAYLYDLLNALDEEQIVLRFNGEQNPLSVYIEDDENFVHVIMPMSR